jgi:hypothetical protein
MKKTILIFAITLFGYFGAFAQNSPTQETKPFLETYINQKVEEFSQKAGITEEQKLALSTTFNDAVTNIKSLYMEGKKLNFTEIRTTVNQQVKEILDTDEQYNALVHFVKEQIPYKTKTNNNKQTPEQGA